MKSIQTKFKYWYLDQTALPGFHQPRLEQPELNQTSIWSFIRIISNSERQSPKSTFISVEF